MVQGRLTLLLGPPGSGKSTLLKALAGKLGGKSPQITGNITYNGESLSSFVPQRTAAYVSQVSWLSALSTEDLLPPSRLCSSQILLVPVTTAAKGKATVPQSILRGFRCCAGRQPHR